jgi:hypothetical protein
MENCYNLSKKEAQILGIKIENKHTGHDKTLSLSPLGVEQSLCSI